MRILFTQETDWLKRNPAQQHHLAEMLSLRGHDVRAIDYELLWRTKGHRELYSRRQIFSSVSKIHEGASVDVIRPGIIKLPLLEYVSLIFSHRKEINRQIAEFKPDLIVGWGILNSYLALKAAQNHKIPFLYYWVDVLDRLIPFRPSQMIGKFVEGETLKQSDRIVVINDKLKDYVTGLGAPPELTHVLRAGIDTGQFNPDSNHREVRKQHGFKEDDIILFFMGWLYDFSGLKEVVLKFAQIKNDKLKLLIVGDGDLFNELKEIQNKYNLEGKIMLVGKKTYQEIPDFIAAANICLLPAYPWEPIMQDIVPIKMYEYMAMKKPVITTRLPGVMKEFGEDNGVVYVDTPDDVIAKAMQLMQNGKVAELGLKARKLVERYSWDKITDEFEKIMVKALEEKGNERLSKRV